METCVLALWDSSLGADEFVGAVAIPAFLGKSRAHDTEGVTAGRVGGMCGITEARRTPNMSPCAMRARSTSTR